jgi:hypothetical protein
MGKRFVAFIDILGFKEMVYKTTHEKLVERFNKIFQMIIAISNSKKGIITKGEKAFIDTSDVFNNVFFISDSIFLWTDTNTVKEFIDLIIVVYRLLDAGIKNNIPLRGGLSYGDFFYQLNSNNSSKQNVYTTMMGKALTQAYELERNTDWFGCTIDNLCFEYLNPIDKDKIINYISNEQLLIIKYPVPFKNCEPKEQYVINWLKKNEGFLKEKNQIENIHKNFDHLDLENADDSIRLKVENTKRFVYYINENFFGKTY